MGIKKSLGYSPLGEPGTEDSQFNFVADRKPPGAGTSTSIFKEVDHSGGLKLASSFSEKVIKRAEEEARESQADNGPKPEKKVASYYLEIETLDRMKSYADREEVSYSSVVETALRKHLSDLRN